MTEPTKGEIEHSINTLEKQIASLEQIENRVLAIRDDIKLRAEIESSSAARDQLNLRSAEAKANKTVKAIGDLLGALTATVRALNHDIANAPKGLFDQDKTKPKSTSKTKPKSPTTAKKKK